MVVTRIFSSWLRGLDRLRDLLTFLMVHTQTFSCPYRWKEMATFPSMIYIFTGGLMALWDMRYTINPLIPTTYSGLVLINTVQQAHHALHTDA
jgi:hypothetical protein